MSEDVLNEEILTLSPLEHVRLRPGVYAGDTSTPMQLLTEVFANALDCYNAGYGDKIIIKIDKDGTITCEDFGQGFAINEAREDGTTTLEAAFSVMNTSGKFTDSGLYEGTSLGLNGMGSKICTFLSHWLLVTSGRGGKSETLMFTEGVLTERTIGVTPTNYSGTKVTFRPSEEFFDTPFVDLKKAESFFNDIACLCPGLTIQFNNKTIKKTGINDLLENKIGNAIEIINNRLIFNETNSGQSFNLGMTFTGNSSSIIVPYVNCGVTDSGPHITSIKSVITRTLNNWAKENNLFKKGEKNLDGSSIQEGLILVCNITSSSAAYNAQVKTTITKIDTSFISSTLGQQLEIWLDNNPEDGKAIIEKALVARRAAEAAKKARAAVKAKAEPKTKFKVPVMPSKLADCNCKDRTQAELYLCEGDSASGGAKMIRDANTQAIMGLRGKVINALTAKPESLLKNAEVVDILKALGFNYSLEKNHIVVDYNESRLRYGKIIIASDKDNDGYHIQCLLLVLFWALVPDLILNGHVYIADPPLYKAEFGKEYKYLSDVHELEEFKKNHSKFTLSYFKGLGEVMPEELGWMIMKPETRKLIPVTVEDVGLADITINNLMGSDSAPKKKFVFGNQISEII